MLVAIGLLLLCAHATLAQSPPRLTLYTSSDGAFRFVYTDDSDFDLLVGERIAKATQGKHGAIPVCNFLTALVCVIYPMNRFENTNLEGAGFSVNKSGAATESDCLDFADRVDQVMIGGREFRHAFTKSSIPEHSQSVHLYRTFHDANCYELRMAVSQSEGAFEQAVPHWRSLTPEEVEKVREPLRLMLSTFSFLK